MQTVLVSYSLPKAPPRRALQEKFVDAANNIFKDLPGLLSKQFCYDETTGKGQSVYLWETREQAEAFFSPTFIEHFRETFGVEPTLAYLDILVLTDNRVGDVIVNNQ